VGVVGVGYWVPSTCALRSTTGVAAAVQDQHFVDCVLDGTRPATDGGSGLSVVQALECAQISLAEQRPVALTEVSRQPAAAAAFAGAPTLPK
jgi:hypothetical protein